MDIESPQLANDISNLRISSFAEDEHGHIWIGTFRGLNRFNVHEFHQHFCTDEENSLPDNQIQCLYKDSRNRLWVSCVNGMALYTDKDDFKRIPMDSFSRNSVQILEDSKGKIYINTSISLCRYDEQKEEFVEIKRLVDSGLPPVSACFIAPNDDVVMVGSMSILRFEPETMEIKETIPLDSYPSSFNLTSGRFIWMSTYKGLQMFDLATSSFIELPEALTTHKTFRQASVSIVHQHTDNLIIFNSRYISRYFN